MQPTTIILQLADRSLAYPRGIVEDVLVKVDEFILDMEEDSEIPIIFGRPFLATGKAIIDVQQGKLTLRVNDENVVFNIYKSLSHHDEGSTCHAIDIIDYTISKHVKVVLATDHSE